MAGPTDAEIRQRSVEFRDDENAEETLHAKGANCETPVIHFNLAHAVASAVCSRNLSEFQRNTFRGAHVAPTWFERLVVPSVCCSSGSPKPTPSWSQKHASENAVIFQFF